MSLSNVDDKAYYKLVLENPKACSDYFYEIFTMFFECIVLGYFQVVDFWYRFEWQMRGSPHVHGVMWLSNAVDVKMLESKFEEVKISVINFFDRLISCETPNPNFVDVGTHPCSVKIADTTCVEDDLSALINTVQMHECSKRCTNDGKTKCKYGFPKDLRENSDLVLSKRKYYEFHGKRNHPNINQYNTIWLRSLRSNCDFGAILSDGGFRHYIAKYASKSEVKSRPLLDILSSILSGINESTSVRSTIQRSFMAALVERDYSAQEVHHLLCGKKLFSCSRSFVKVNLKTSNWKYHMNLDDDVLKDSYNHILYSYSKRPLKLHNVCLLQYVEMFNIEKYSVRRRKAVAVVFPRLRCHGDNIDLEEIARQLVLLYVPWIDLDEICGNGNQWQDIMRKYNLSINLLPYYKGQEATESMNELISSDNENDDVSEESGPTCDKDDWMLFVGASVGENTSSHPVQEFVVTSWVRNYCSSEDGLTFMKFIDDAKKEGIEHVLRYRDQNIKLSEDQKHIINLASCQISCIKDGSGLSNFPQLVLCQGAAGSGKTLVIAELECMITEAFGNDSALIIAFTGSAALNANGRTIQSALRLQFDNKSKDVIDLKGDTLRAFEEKMRNVKFLIIEEFSMVGCRLFNIINRRCMQMKSSTEPFGGLPVYMFGDLFQLPPIGDTPLYNLNIDPFKTIAYSGSILFRSLVHTKFFSACHRQRDQEFLNFLENLSYGIVTVPGQMYISDRFEENMTHEEIESFSDAVHLFQHVKATEDYNKNKLLELGKPIIQICAKNNNFYAKCSSDDLACNLQNTLELSIGARVMLRSNLWTEGGLVNGCIGYVEDVLYCNEIDEEYPSIIMVKFDSYFGPTLSNGCVPITRITRSWTVNNIHCTRYQFPLTLAYAITIHKSQGLTLSKCVLHFDCAEIMSGIFYVSMYRVREKTDLMISGNFMGSPLFRINSANYKAKIAGRQWLMERSRFEVTKEKVTKEKYWLHYSSETFKSYGNTSDSHSETHQRLAPVVKSPVERRQDHMMPSCSSEEAAISSSNTMQYRPAEHLEALSSPPGPSSSGTNGSRNEMVHHNTRTPTESEGNSSDSESENHHSLPSALKRQMSSCSSPAPASSSSNSMPQPGAEHSEALTSQPGPSSTSGNNRSGNVIEQHNARPATESEASVNRNQQGSSSPNSVPPPQHLPEDVAEGGGATARERFNNRNQQVTPLRKCSELVPGRRYKIMNLSRTNTQYGPAIRALIEDDRSPTGRSFIYLPVRFRSMSDEDITELNSQANSSDGLFIVYNGRVDHLGEASSKRVLYPGLSETSKFFCEQYLSLGYNSLSGTLHTIDIPDVVMGNIFHALKVVGDRCKGCNGNHKLWTIAGGNVKKSNMLRFLGETSDNIPYI
ncbi:ATP-dependent DNA helicase [Frankliniella fusca]|uniref:ATP-dependent DNA helicase n=1 Tax=Frankliniella fusca TaxID=407009 RepID=A0AAE1HD97_9NEOP|nr:ATP-dependent DNA helicase [Frankliniella fusca]